MTRCGIQSTHPFRRIDSFDRAHVTILGPIWSKWTPVQCSKLKQLQLAAWWNEVLFYKRWARSVDISCQNTIYIIYYWADYLKSFKILIFCGVGVYWYSKLASKNSPLFNIFMKNISISLFLLLQRHKRIFISPSILMESAKHVQKSSICANIVLIDYYFITGG